MNKAAMRTKKDYYYIVTAITVAAMLAFVYPLSKKRVNRNVEILRERRKKLEEGK